MGFALENLDNIFWAVLPLFFLLSIYLSFSNKETARFICLSEPAGWLHYKWVWLAADWAVMLLLWLPIETGLVAKLAMKFIGPDADDAQIYWELFALVPGLIWFLGFRKYDIHYRLWSKNKKDWKEVLKNFFILLPILIGLGFFTGFIEYTPKLTLAKIL